MDKFQALLQHSKLALFGVPTTDRAQFLSQLASREDIALFLEWGEQLPNSFFNNWNTYIFINSEDANQIQTLLDQLRDNSIESTRITQINSKEIMDIPSKLLKLWGKSLDFILESEISFAKQGGALAILDHYNPIFKGSGEERARLSLALATQITSDLNQIEKIVRLALYYPLHSLTDWPEIINQTPNLWVLRDFFQQKNKAISPSELCVEILIVEIACLAQSLASTGNSASFNNALKQFSASLPFKMKTQLRTGAEQCFKQIWKLEDEVA